MATDASQRPEILFPQWQKEYEATLLEPEPEKWKKHKAHVRRKNFGVQAAVSMSKIRVLVVEDHTIVRHTICALLAEEPTLDVVAKPRLAKRQSWKFHGLQATEIPVPV